MNNKRIIILSLINTLIVNGLVTNDGEFDNRKNYIKFDDHNDNLDISPHIAENQGKPVTFVEDITTNDKENFFQDSNTKTTINNIEHDNNVVVFEDKKEMQNIGNEINNFVERPRRRRKRKPRKQSINGGHNGFVNQGIYEGQYSFGVERPKRRKRLPQKQSLTEQASSTFLNALTSISLYDDQQCIPKLLCDTTAGRKGGFSGGSMLQGFIDLQPLMTLLLAYNGATASPLFSFGRAIIIGMSSSQHNPYICRKSYPLCPSDPDKLVHYLNNHNGGFFRFFNNINNNQQQSLNQFLGHLSNAPPGFDQNIYAPQKFGLEQNFNQFGYPQNNNLLGNQQNFNRYGALQNQNGYGIFQYQNQVNNKYSKSDYKSRRGDLDKQLFDHELKLQSNIESRNDDQEVSKYDSINDLVSEKKYKQNENSSSLTDNSIKISRRIITKSGDDEDEKDEDNNNIEAFEDSPKWLIPQHDEKFKRKPINHHRKMKTLLFPDEYDIITNNANHNLNLHQGAAVYRPPLNNKNNNDNNKKLFVFPENNHFNNYRDYTNNFETNEYNRIENKVNVKYESSNSNKYVKDDEFETVYVVRGNGDPNYPEVVRIRPGTLL